MPIGALLPSIFVKRTYPAEFVVPESVQSTEPLGLYTVALTDAPLMRVPVVLSLTVTVMYTVDPREYVALFVVTVTDRAFALGVALASFDLLDSPIELMAATW